MRTGEPEVKMVMWWTILVVGLSCGCKTFTSEEATIKSINSVKVGAEDPVGRAAVAVYVDGVVFQNICSGLMVSDTYVLTAAHCFFEDGVFPKKLFVSVGYNARGGQTPNRTTTSNSRKFVEVLKNEVLAKKIYSHSGYAIKAKLNPADGEHENQEELEFFKGIDPKDYKKLYYKMLNDRSIALHDIALIEVPQPPPGKKSQPNLIQIPSGASNVSNRPLRAMGYGLNTDDVYPYPDGTLREVFYKKKNRFSDARKLIGLPMKDDSILCSGDSGSPVFDKNGDLYNVVGVLSGTLSYCDRKAPHGEIGLEAYWTDVITHADWIRCVLALGDNTSRSKCDSEWQNLAITEVVENF